MIRIPVFKYYGSILLLLFVMISLSMPAVAQECTSVDVALSTQQSVDSFQADYGPCDRVIGTLSISGGGITNVDGLSGLTQLHHLIISGNPQLIRVDGLSGLLQINGNLEVSHNDSLIEIDGLAGVRDIDGDVLIWDNDDLEDLNGLTRLDDVNGDLSILDNSLLSDLSGLSRIRVVGGSVGIESNGNLDNLDGLSGLVTVDGTFRIQTEDLEDIDGLSQLSRVGGRLIVYNTNLRDVDGLAGVTQLGSDLWITLNDRLLDLDGLSGLTSARNVLIEENRRLADCQGLVKLLDPIDHYIPGPGPGLGGVPDVADRVDISNNQEGCNSLFEILVDVDFFTINAGMNDAWFNPDTPGQGFFIIVLPNLKQVFLAWFTYDTERPPADVAAFLGEPGHRWLTAQGPFDGNIAVLPVFVTEGGVFDSPLPMPITTPDGEIIVEFIDCNSGTITYDIPSINRQGVIPIERVSLDNIAQCYLLGNPLPETPTE